MIPVSSLVNRQAIRFGGLSITDGPFPGDVVFQLHSRPVEKDAYVATGEEVAYQDLLSDGEVRRWKNKQITELSNGMNKGHMPSEDVVKQAIRVALEKAPLVKELRERLLEALDHAYFECKTVVNDPAGDVRLTYDRDGLLCDVQMFRDPGEPRKSLVDSKDLLQALPLSWESYKTPFSTDTDQIEAEFAYTPGAARIKDAILNRNPDALEAVWRKLNGE